MTAKHDCRFSMVDHALAYARAGLPVIPLQPVDKVPACAHGKDDATLDLDRITRWWADRPDCNIGIRPPRGIVVLDVDPRNGGNEDLAALNARYGALPATWTARTGQGGQHIWLRADGPYRGKQGTGIDIKSHSGYLVAPPSVHPNGQRYEWINSHPIAYAPPWLKAKIAPPQPLPSRPRLTPVAIDGSALVNTVATAPEGKRNHLLYWAACRAIAEGTYPHLREALADAATATGLTATEVGHTLKSAESKGN